MKSIVKIINNRVNGVSAVSRPFGDTPLNTLHDLQCNTIHKSSTNGGTYVLRLPMKGNNSKAKLPLIRLVIESLVIAVPEIYTELITPQTDFASLASDGLWDTMSPQLAIFFVKRTTRKRLKQWHKKPCVEDRLIMSLC